MAVMTTEVPLPKPRQRAHRAADVAAHVMPTSPDLVATLAAALTMVNKVEQIEAELGPATIHTAGQTTAEPYSPANFEAPEAPLPRRPRSNAYATDRIVEARLGAERFYFKGSGFVPTIPALGRTAFQRRRLRVAYVLLVLFGHLGTHHRYFGQNRRGLLFFALTAVGAWQVYQSQVPTALGPVWIAMVADAFLIPTYEERQRKRQRARFALTAR